jgi:hypothetical protein
MSLNVRIWLSTLIALALTACASSPSHLPDRDEVVPRPGEGDVLLSFEYRDPPAQAAPAGLLATGEIELQLAQVDSQSSSSIEIAMPLAQLLGDLASRQIVLRGLPPGRYHFVRRSVRMFRGAYEYHVETVEAERSTFLVRPGVVTYAGVQVLSVIAKQNVLGVVVPVRVHAELEDRFSADANLLCQRVPRSCTAHFLNALTGHEGPLPEEPKQGVRQPV